MTRQTDHRPPSSHATTDRRASLGEMAIVLGLTVGMMLVGSLSVVAIETDPVVFTDQHLAALVGYELILAALLVPWLSSRGWSPRAVAGDPTPTDVAWGIGLWLAAITSSTVLLAGAAALHPEAAHAMANAPHPEGGSSGIAVVVASILNPIFEEFLWLGYIVPSLSPRLGLRGAAAVSVALRVSVHAYQGPWGLLSILAIGVILTWYYGSTRRLWPVIVAHMIIDVVGLAQYIGSRA